MNILPVGSPIIAKTEERQIKPAAPAVPDKEDGGATPVAHEELTGAVKKINESLQASAQNLEFSIDQDSDQIVVKVIDQNTKEVLRQMPTQEALDIAKSLDKMRGLLLRQTA